MHCDEYQSLNNVFFFYDVSSTIIIVKVCLMLSILIIYAILKSNIMFISVILLFGVRIFNFFIVVVSFLKGKEGVRGWHVFKTSARKNQQCQGLIWFWTTFMAWHICLSSQRIYLNLQNTWECETKEENWNNTWNLGIKKEKKKSLIFRMPCMKHNRKKNYHHI